MLVWGSCEPMRYRGYAVALIVALVSAACARSSTQSTRTASTPAAKVVAGFTSRDFIGTWRCNETSGRLHIVTYSTTRANGTSIGYGIDYGHRTPTYESSWSYAPSSPTRGISSSNNNAFAPPHYTATSSVTWLNRNRFKMLVLTDRPNIRAVGSRLDCARQR
jgi:hypothetical protein